MNACRRGWVAIPLGLALVVIAAAGSAAQARRVGLLVAPFAGPEPLGRKAATVLQLQVWQTLRAAPPKNVHKLSFGSGIVYWDEGSPPTAHAEALERISGLDAQLVLWGRAQEFGKGVVVQSYLSVAPGAAGARTPVVWRIPLPEIEGPQGTLTVGLPSQVFEFAPIVLRPEVIPMLNTPEGIPIFEDRAFRKPVGQLGPDFRALEQGPDSARVQSAGVTGWVRLPGLSANRSEVTDFSGGLVRILRRDWGGAIDLLTRVVNTPSAPVNIKVSSYLLMAAASRLLHEQIGASDRSLEYIDAAEKLNPFLRETVRYKCMALLAGKREPERIRRLDDTVRRSEYLFPKGDAWLGKVKRVLESASREPAR